jgi:ribosomal protein S18 acetylase RimI-like enzyme
MAEPGAAVHVDPKIRKVLDLYADVLTGDFYSRPIRTQLELQAIRLTEAHRARNDAVCFQIASWHPDLTGTSDDRILANAFALDDGPSTIAREHGFADWEQVSRLAGMTSDVAFEGAVNTMLSGDLSSLRSLVEQDRGLLGARSRYGHRATLLHYVGTNGVESYRQVVPLNLAEVVEFLLASGADPSAKAQMYGGGTARELFESSRHSREAGVLESVSAVFRKYEVEDRRGAVGPLRADRARHPRSPGMAPMITVAAEGDLSEVRELFLEYAASLEVDLAYQDFPREVAGLPGDYAPPGGCLLIARDGGAAIGCVAVRPIDEDRCEMKRLYVRPVGRGSGLGRQLTEAAIAFGRAAGFRAMRLDTLPAMAAAQSLYRELGFQIIPAYRSSPVAGNLYMELVLGAPRGPAEPGRPG